MDIFGKVTSRMVLDNVGYKEDLSYHEYNPEWGADILKVGNSLGAGSIAYAYNDSLFRVGDNGVGSCKILTEGPIRSIFRFKFTDWKMGDQTLNIIHDVSIQAGKYYYESTVSYSGTDEEIELVTGIVNAKSKQVHKIMDPTDYYSFYTFDLQAEDTTLLGMGIIVPSDILNSVTTAPEQGDGIIETYCIHLQTMVDKAVKFRFYSVWERENGQWKSADGFESLLRNEADCMAKPIHVEITNI
jgi:hypothetical protein